MRLSAICAVVLCLLWSAGHVWAHTGHPSSSKQKDSTTMDSTMRDSAVGTVAPGTVTETQSPRTVEYQLHIREALSEHLHNRLVHFPVALSVMGLILTIVYRRRPQVLPAIQLIVICAAIMALAAVVTGLGQAGVFTGSSKEWVVDTHRQFGIASTVLLWLWTGFLFWKPLQRFAWIIAVLTALCVIAAGFYGGVISYG